MSAQQVQTVMAIGAVAGLGFLGYEAYSSSGSDVDKEVTEDDVRAEGTATRTSDLASYTDVPAPPTDEWTTVTNNTGKATYSPSDTGGSDTYTAELNGSYMDGATQLDSGGTTHFVAPNDDGSYSDYSSASTTCVGIQGDAGPIFGVFGSCMDSTSNTDPTQAGLDYGAAIEEGNIGLTEAASVTSDLMGVCWASGTECQTDNNVWTLPGIVVTPSTYIYDNETQQMVGVPYTFCASGNYFLPGDGPGQPLADAFNAKPYSGRGSACMVMDPIDGGIDAYSQARWAEYVSNVGAAPAEDLAVLQEMSDKYYSCLDKASTADSVSWWAAAGAIVAAPFTGGTSLIPLAAAAGATAAAGQVAKASFKASSSCNPSGATYEYLQSFSQFEGVGSSSDLFMTATSSSGQDVFLPNFANQNALGEAGWDGSVTPIMDPGSLLWQYQKNPSA